jgi:hypothetical protein
MSLEKQEWDKRGEPDNFKRVMTKMIAKYALIMEDLFTNVETLLVYKIEDILTYVQLNYI